MQKHQKWLTQPISFVDAQIKALKICGIKTLSKSNMKRQDQTGSAWNEASDFPISCDNRTNKLQKRTSTLTAPLAPLSHTSCHFLNHNPGAMREVPLHVCPGAGQLSQGNKLSQ